VFVAVKVADGGIQRLITAVHPLLHCLDLGQGHIQRGRNGRAFFVRCQIGRRAVNFGAQATQVKEQRFLRRGAGAHQ
jgi:hypothetical protein